jgi:hypothetical protein
MALYGLAGLSTSGCQRSRGLLDRSWLSMLCCTLSLTRCPMPDVVCCSYLPFRHHHCNHTCLLQVPVVKYLLEHGADTQIYNDSGKLAGEEFDVLFEVSRCALSMAKHSKACA